MLFKLLLIPFLFIIYSISQDIRSLELTSLADTKYQCTNSNCLSSTIVSAMSLRDCQFACLADAQCLTASFSQSINQCELFANIPGQNGVLLTEANVVTMISIDNRQRFTLPEVNWLINGDAETGPCELSNGITYPTDWNYNGSITQMHYNNTYGHLLYTSPGPSNCGNCYFIGGTSSVTLMWQTMNMTSSISPSLIDTQTIQFNFSAWIGGYDIEDDNACASLIFEDQNNQPVGNTTILGPVLAVDRGDITSLLFRQANGYVPIGARSFKVIVTMNLVNGTNNNGLIDNIAVVLHQ